MLICLPCALLPAEQVATRNKPAEAAANSRMRQPHAWTLRMHSIHWQRVPISDAIQRLKPLFEETIFVDRRVDPSTRVTLDIEANSAEEVVAAIAQSNNLEVARLKKMVYLGPKTAADQLRAISTVKTAEAARSPAAVRVAWARKEGLTWPRLSEPRTLISDVVNKRGWHVANPEVIPHDLWAAGELPEMPLAEQLSVLLIGFDLTFKFDVTSRTIEIVVLDRTALSAPTQSNGEQTTRTRHTPRPKADAKHVYTLRVNEQPVRAILRHLSQQLHWPIEIDEQAIGAAGKSVDTRVSFSVENADQDALLKAILTPAGLSYVVEDERVRITAAEKK
jgi:type II secretory pathway component GspD/PulD (secretin)